MATTDRWVGPNLASFSTKFGLFVMFLFWISVPGTINTRTQLVYLGLEARFPQITPAAPPSRGAPQPSAADLLRAGTTVLALAPPHRPLSL